MAWQASEFAQIPKFGSAIQVPSDAIYSGSINSIAALRTAVADKTIDVIEWNGSYVDDRVEINTSHTNSGQRRYITGTGNLPPIRVMGGEVGKGWTIFGMTLGAESATAEGAARIDLINAKDFTLSDCSRSWPGNGVVVAWANLRNGSTRNITIQRCVFIGTQTSAKEFMAVIAPSWTSNFYGNDYWSSGQQQWSADSDNVRFIDNQCHNIGDGIQLQCELNVAENRPRHYSTIDHKNVEIAGNLFTCDPGLAENAVDLKGSAQNYDDRAKIHHNIISGFRPSSGGGTDALGEAIVVHFQHQHVEITDNIIDDCYIGCNIKPPSGSVNILRNRFSNLDEIVFVGEQWNYDSSTADINVDECLIDNAPKLMDNMTGGRVDTLWQISNTVIRNVPNSGQTTTGSVIGGNNYFSGSLLGGLTGSPNVTMATVGALLIPGGIIDVFNGYPDTHTWALNSLVAGEGERHKVMIGGGRQTYTALTGYPAGTTLAAVGNLPQTAANKTKLGHYMHIGASYGLGFEGRKTQTMASLQAYLLNDDFEGGLFHLYWKDQDKYAPFIQELLNAARPYGKQILIDYSDIRFNANGLSLSDAPVPQYVKDEGRVTFSGNASNQAICSSMATDSVCAGYWLSSFDAFEHWDDDPAFGGIMTPETTRSSSATAGGPYANIGDGMTDLFMDLIDTVKPKLQKTTLIISINFTGGGNVKFRELFNKASAVGGVAITHPDTIEGRDPARFGGVVDYAYDHYNVMREFSDIVLIAVCMQTRDIDDDLDACLELVLAKIGVFSRSLQANIIIHYDWHPDYGDAWEDTVVAKVRTWNAVYHTTVPSSMNYVTSNTLVNGSDQLVHGTAYKNGQKVDVVPKVTASIGDLDSLSIFTTYAGTTTESIEYFEYIEGEAAPVSDGAPIEREFHSYEVGSGAYSVTSSHATRKWSVNNTVIAGYSGSGYLQAEGYNTNAEADIGGTQRIPLSDLTSGISFKAWNRVRAEDGGSDSLWLLKEGSNPQLGGDTYVTSALHGAWNWVPARDTAGDVLLLSSADTAYIGAVREKDLKWSKTIFIDANESAVPTGKDGFYYLDSKVNDDQFDVAANLVGVVLDVLANDDSDLTLADIVGAPVHGQASVDVGNNVILYSPDNGYIGEDSISYRAQDLEGNDYTAFASIAVAVSPPPTANPITVTDNAAGDLVVDFGDQTSSPTGLDLTLAHYPEFPQYYTTSVTGLVVTYTALVAPPISFGGTYSITDSAGNTASNWMTATRLVLDNNDPSPATDTVTTPAGIPVVITPLSNDIDPDGHELTLLGLVDEPSNGTATTTGNSITYVSNEGFGGMEVLTYTVRDIYGASAEGTIKIAVVGPNGVGVKVGGVITATIRVVGK